MSQDDKRLALAEPLVRTKTLVKKLAKSARVARRAINEDRWRRGPLMSAAERLAETLAALMEAEDDNGRADQDAAEHPLDDAVGVGLRGGDQPGGDLAD